MKLAVPVFLFALIRNGLAMGQYYHRRPVRITALRRAGVFAFEPGPASRQHAPTPERCPRPEPLGRNGPPAFPLCHKVSGPFRAPSALPSQWTQGRQMDSWRSARTKPDARVFVVA